MKHLTPYRQNETSLSPMRGRGMVYGGGMMSENSTEIFQVEVHQTCIIVLVFLCKETEFVTLVEPRCCSERIYCNKATTCSISMSKYVLYTIQYESAYSLAGILFVYSQTSHFNGGIMIPLFAERYLTIDAITHALICLIKTNDIVQQTIIGYDVTILRINKEIGDSKVFCLIIFRFIQQKFVQVAFSTLERSKICLGCQYPNRYIGEVHLNKGQSGELCLNISYACRALSFSSSDTGDGWSMCQRKRSASLPVSTGVSLIGLAIINLYLVSAANLRIISE